MTDASGAAAASGIPGHRGRYGHTEARKSLELAAGGGVGIDAGNDDGTHVTNLAAREAGSKGSVAG